MRLTRMTARSRMQRTGLVSCLALAGMLAIPAVAEAGGSASIHFYVQIGSSCVGGGGPANKSLDVVLKDADGTVKTTASGTTDGSGSFQLSCMNAAVEIGDTLRATVGAVTGKFKVPVLTASADRDTDLVSGRGPKDSHVSMTAWSCPGYAGCVDAHSEFRPTNGSGNWSKDLTPIYDAKGHDYVSVSWQSPQMDSVYVYGYFAYFVAVRGWTYVGGLADRGALVTLTLKTGGAVRGTARDVVPWGYPQFSGQFRNSVGQPQVVHAGDKVKADFASTTMTVPAAAATATASTDAVSGTCLANRAFQVYAYDPSSPYRSPSYSYANGTANGTGHFSADMSNASYPTFDLQSADAVQVRCLTGAGDETGVNLTVP